MKHELCAADLERLPFEVRVYIDHHLDHGAKLEAFSARRCRRDLKAAPLAPYMLVEEPWPVGLAPHLARRRSGRPDFRGLDDWDMKQGFTPEHIPPRSHYFDLASANAMFKEVYSSDRLENLAYADSPLMRMLPR